MALGLGAFSSTRSGSLRVLPPLGLRSGARSGSSTDSVNDMVGGQNDASGEGVWAGA